MEAKTRGARRRQELRIQSLRMAAGKAGGRGVGGNCCPSHVTFPAAPLTRPEACFRPFRLAARTENTLRMHGAHGARFAARHGYVFARAAL